jgi:hypothetical protein
VTVHNDLHALHVTETGTKAGGRVAITYRVS